MTGREILEAEFEKSGMRGYRADQVDALLQSVATFVDNQSAQIDDLTYKVKILADKIEEYKKDEESIRDALLGAQKMGSSVLNEAKAKADSLTREAKQVSDELISSSTERAQKLLNDAQRTSDEMLGQATAKIENLTRESLQKANIEINQAKKESERERKMLDAMKQEVSNFRSSILKQYKTHLDLLSNLPSVEDEERVVRNTQKAAVIEEDTPNTPIDLKEAVSSENSLNIDFIAESRQDKASGSFVRAEQENSEDAPVVFGESHTIKSDIIVEAAEDDDLAMAQREHTREFAGRSSVNSENDTIEIKKAQSNNEDEAELKKENDSLTKAFMRSSKATSFAEKYGELDFGSHRDK